MAAQKKAHKFDGKYKIYNRILPMFGVVFL